MDENPEEKKEDSMTAMSDANGILVTGKSSLMTTVGAASEAVKIGVGVAVGVEAAKLCVQAAHKMLGDNYPEFFKQGIGQQLEPFFAAFLMHFLATAFESRIPHAGKIRDLSALAMQGAGRDVIEPSLKTLSEMASSFAGLNE
jgi:hypothetical protein